MGVTCASDERVELCLAPNSKKGAKCQDFFSFNFGFSQYKLVDCDLNTGPSSSQVQMQTLPINPLVISRGGAPLLDKIKFTCCTRVERPAVLMDERLVCNN